MSKKNNALDEFYQRVDGDARGVAEKNKNRLTCKRGCDACCQDDLTVFELEADHILARYAGRLEGQKPAQAGRCAFLNDQGACRIYEARPYICRTQGLPLRWFEEGEDWDLHEFRDICPLNAPGPDLKTLADENLWTIGTYEGELAQMQYEQYGGQMDRRALRALFTELADG